jgi:hypothetical protein
MDVNHSCQYPARKGFIFLRITQPQDDGKSDDAKYRYILMPMLTEKRVRLAVLSNKG